MNAKQVVNVKIPFSGFYESVHSLLIDHELESLLCSYLDYEPDSAQIEFAWDLLDLNLVHNEYVEAYVEHLKDFFGCDSMEFESLEYGDPQGDGDRLFCNVELKDMQYIAGNTDKDAMDKVAKERHTSYSGFWSHYSPNWEDWGNVKDYDHNQFETLFWAYALTEAKKEGSTLEEYWSDGMFSFFDSSIAGDVLHSQIEPHIKEIVDLDVDL